MSFVLPLKFELQAQTNGESSYFNEENPHVPRILNKWAKGKITSAWKFENRKKPRTVTIELYSDGNVYSYLYQKTKENREEIYWTAAKIRDFGDTNNRFDGIAADSDFYKDKLYLDKNCSSEERRANAILILLEANVSGSNGGFSNSDIDEVYKQISQFVDEGSNSFKKIAVCRYSFRTKTGSSARQSIFSSGFSFQGKNGAIYAYFSDQPKY